MPDLRRLAILKTRCAIPENIWRGVILPACGAVPDATGRFSAKTLPDPQVEKLTRLLASRSLPAVTPETLEAFDERAAIMQYDGGVPCALAELCAYLLTAE